MIQLGTSNVYKCALLYKTKKDFPLATLQSMSGKKFCKNHFPYSNANINSSNTYDSKFYLGLHLGNLSKPSMCHNLNLWQILIISDNKTKSKKKTALNFKYWADVQPFHWTWDHLRHGGQNITSHGKLPRSIQHIQQG